MHTTPEDEEQCKRFDREKLQRKPLASCRSRNRKTAAEIVEFTFSPKNQNKQRDALPTLDRRAAEHVASGRCAAGSSSSQGPDRVCRCGRGECVEEGYENHGHKRK